MNISVRVRDHHRSLFWSLIRVSSAIVARKKSRQLQVSITHDLGPLLFIRVSITAGANFPAVLERQIDAFATDCFAWLVIGLVKETLHRADIEWFPSSREEGAMK